MKTVIVTGASLVANSDNCDYKYKFPVGAVEFKNKEIAVSSISMYYSWPNIHARKYANNTFTYTWIDGTVVTVMIPDGFYTVSDLNSYLQNVMADPLGPKHYLVDSSGNYVYYLELLENSVYYAVELNAYAVPTSLPSGYSLPTGASWSLPTPNAKTPQFTFSGNFCNVVGFTADTYPQNVQTTDYSVTSTVTPQVTPVSTVLVGCSIVDNKYTSPDNIIYGFSPSVTYGSQILMQPSELTWIDLKDGTFPDFTLSFRDQSFNTLPIKDSNICVILAVKDKNNSL